LDIVISAQLKLYNEEKEIIEDQDLFGKAGARHRHQIAMIHHVRGEYEEALKLYNESL
jgi:hypothetical protein